MANVNKINTDVLNDLIIGRVEPQIYAFTTETVPVTLPKNRTD